MNATPAATVDALANDATTFPITVLLVDDQPIIGEAVRRMLQDEADVDFHFCQDPTQALAMANQVRPTVILQDLVMPVVDGLTLVKFFRANPATCETPMIVLSSKEEPIVKAEAFAVGANDYLVKLPDKVELVARIRYHSKGYINLLQRNEAYEAIARSRKHLAEQMEAGAKYLLSLLPVPVHEPVRIDWRYTPSADLGGDTFGYHALDEDRFAIYLLDVTGHGLDSALFSVTVMNVLRSRALPNTDFGDPGQVLVALNEKFPMELYGEKMFTIWYGVYHRAARTLTWSGGGHPDALFFEGPLSNPGPATRLESVGPMMGMMPWTDFDAQQRPVPPGARLYVFSDGVHEIQQTDGTFWAFDEFVEFLSTPQSPETSLLDHLTEHVHQLRGSEVLDDDFSIIEAVFA